MIFDTNAVSDFAEDDPRLLAVLPGDRPWLLPVVVIGEYLFGLRSSNQRSLREQWLARLIAVVQVLAVEEPTTHHYAGVRHELKIKNRKIPPNDAWIAALALQYESPILSRDSHFDHITGVQRISW